jgi:ABC-2 type transport system permease protein
LFAIFFIVIPLSINIVKEKPGHFHPIAYPSYIERDFDGRENNHLPDHLHDPILYDGRLGGIFVSGLGLPALNVEGNMLLMSIVAAFSGFAAIGFGILLGTVAKTQEQSAPFEPHRHYSGCDRRRLGSGFAMPELMQVIARSSPMNWGLNAFYDVLLRNCTLASILPEIALLFLFS